MRYVLQAVEGNVYEIEVTLDTLSDSVLSIYDMDGESELATNDDYGGSLSSYIEWTCPRTGGYPIDVHGFSESQTGTFALQVTSTGDMAAAGSPCAEDGSGTMLPGQTGEITYMPEGAYDNNEACFWHVHCADGAVAHLTFSAFDTEGGWDFVDVYDGADITTPSLGHLSGELASLDEQSFELNQQDMTIGFTTDGSVTHGGFSAEYSCEQPQGPGCVDRLDELMPNSCPMYLTQGHTCGERFCPDCGHFAGMCDLTCGFCHHHR